MSVFNIPFLGMGCGMRMQDQLMLEGYLYRADSDDVLTSLNSNMSKKGSASLHFTSVVNLIFNC